MDISEWGRVELQNIKRLVVVDGPWQRMNMMIRKHAKLSRLRCISIGKAQKAVVQSPSSSTTDDDDDDGKERTGYSERDEVAPPNTRIPTTRFWRVNGRSDHHLSTIEALAWFLRQREEILQGSGNYDDLLVIFSYLHSIVSQAMREKIEIAVKHK